MRYALILAMVASALQAAEAPLPPLVSIGKDGKLVYTPHANVGETATVNVIPDFSHCGYKGGGARIPDVPVKATVEPGEGSARARIQAAIDEVSKLPLDKNGFRGAVLIKAGTHIIGDGKAIGMRIAASGVVVRGEGQGLRGTHLTTGQLGKSTCFTVSGDATFTEGPVSRITDDYVGTGAMTFSVADAQGLAEGDSIRVYFTPNQTWLDIVNQHVNNWTIETYTIPFERRIAKLSGTTITLDTPLVHPLQKRFGGGEVRKITLSKGARIDNVGIENLSLSCPDGAADKNRINDAIIFNHVTDGWVSGITVYHQSDSLVTLNQSRYVTVQDCASLQPVGPKRGGYRYTYYIGSGSNHCLVQRCYAYDGRHDFVTYAYSPGPNVFLDCLTEKGGTQGPHQRWSSGILFDNIGGGGRVAISEHRGGSGTGHGWTGVSDVGWNVRNKVTCDAPEGFQNYSFGGTGAEENGSYVKSDGKTVFRGHYESHGTPVKPRSLYLKQLEDRLGKQAVENVTTPAQRGESPAAFYPSLPQFAAPVTHILDSPIEVPISCPLKDATIRYTLDGSDPTMESPLYTGPLKIDKPCTIKAMALDAHFRSSPIASTSVEPALSSITPRFAPDSVHIFGKPATVTITYPFAGAAIRYTTDGSDPTPQSPLYTAPLTIDAECTIKAIALDKSARSSAASMTKAWVALKPVEAAAVERGFLRCRYYEGKWPSGKVLPDFTTLTPKSESLEAGVVMPANHAKDGFALLYTGYIDVPVDGVYTFVTEANDGANLLISKRLVVDNTVEGGSGSVGLYAGRHPIEIQYWEKAHDQHLRVFWSGPGFERVPLPASVLSCRKPPAE